MWNVVYSSEIPPPFTLPVLQTESILSVLLVALSIIFMYPGIILSVLSGRLTSLNTLLPTSLSPCGKKMGEVGLVIRDCVLLKQGSP